MQVNKENWFRSVNYTSINSFNFERGADEKLYCSTGEYASIEAPRIPPHYRSAYLLSDVNIDGTKILILRVLLYTGEAGEK